MRARTAGDAERYFAQYKQAVQAVATANARRRSERVSIKLSALHPRYHERQRERLMRELLPRLIRLRAVRRGRRRFNRILFLFPSRRELAQRARSASPALKRQGLIDTWHDRRIPAGDEWQQRISEHLEGADVILLLVSPYFIASD